MADEIELAPTPPARPARISFHRGSRSGSKSKEDKLIPQAPAAVR